jgi:hypothetical protein
MAAREFCTWQVLLSGAAAEGGTHRACCQGVGLGREPLLWREPLPCLFWPEGDPNGVFVIVPLGLFRHMQVEPHHGSAACGDTTTMS